MASGLNRLLAAIFLFLVQGVATAALAQPDCTDLPLDAGPNFTASPGCTISWIEHNRLRTLISRGVSDDFQTAQLDQSPSGTVLTASRLPELIDIDQDGWLDLLVFTPLGMVNGSFDIFLYEPSGRSYSPVQSLPGHTLTRDPDGYIVVASRNGPGTIFRFYSIENQRLKFQFEINPYVHDPEGGDGFACRVDVVPSDQQAVTAAGGTVPDNPDLLNYYCDPEPAETRERRDADLSEEPAQIDRVPAGTVFFCRLDPGTHAVTITQTPGGMRYRYGPLTGAPDLVLDRPLDQVRILPENGAGPSRFGEIGFTSDGYTYTAYYSFELMDADGALLQSDPRGLYPNDSFARGLVVIKNGDLADPVFDRKCLLDHSFDRIGTLPASGTTGD